MADISRSENAASQGFTHKIAVRDLRVSGENRFDVTPDSQGRKQVAGLLGLIELRKCRLAGDIRAAGKSNWTLTAMLGATAVQSCVITGDPVTTRVDLKLRRDFIKTPDVNADTDDAMLNEHDDHEPLAEEIDLGFIMTEALALALPDYPRKSGVDLGEAVFTTPGTTALRDKDVKPFASLAALRDKLKD